MTEQTTGAALSSRELAASVTTLLDQQDQQTGLGKLVPREDTSLLDNINEETLTRLTPEELCVKAVLCQNLALYAQRVYNKNNAKANRLEAEIKQKAYEYEGYGYEDKKSKAMRENEYVRNLNDRVLTHRMRCDNLMMVHNHIGNLARAMEELARTRQRLRV